MDDKLAVISLSPPVGKFDPWSAPKAVLDNRLSSGAVVRTTRGNNEKVPEINHGPVANMYSEEDDDDDVVVRHVTGTVSL